MIPETGTYVSGWNGHYTTAEAIQTAAALGHPVPPEILELAATYLRNWEELEEGDNETLQETLDEIERELPTWPGRTYWGNHPDLGDWGHWQLDAIDDGTEPAVHYVIEIYGPTGTEPVARGYAEPNNPWEPHEMPRPRLIQLADPYTPSNQAALLATEIDEWSGTLTTSVTYAMPDGTYEAVARPAEAVHDLAGRVGQPAEHHALRTTYIHGMTKEEAEALETFYP